MPLKLNDNAEDEAGDKQEIGPILHQPGVRRHLSPALILAVIIILLLAVAAFGVYRSGVWKKFRSQKTEQAAPSAPQAAAEPATEVASSDTMRALTAPPVESAPLRRQEELPGEGRYTIYVARQTERLRADDEVARWREAGYPADVVERDGWFCVEVGRYQSREEARAVAERLKDGLEGGYWVSTRE